MQHIRLCGVSSLLLAFTLCHVSAEERSPAPDLQLWVKQLGDDDFNSRKNAAEKLRKNGKAALPLIDPLLQSKDAELKAAAQSLVTGIASDLFLAALESPPGFSATFETYQKYSDIRFSGTVSSEANEGRYCYSLSNSSQSRQLLSDGKTIWSVVRYQKTTDGTPSEMIQKASTALAEGAQCAALPLFGIFPLNGPSKSFRHLATLLNFELPKDGMTDGEDVVVFVGRVQEEPAKTLQQQFATIYGDGFAYHFGKEENLATVRISIGKKDRILRLAEALNADGQVVNSVKVSKVTLAPKGEGHTEDADAWRDSQPLTIWDVDSELKR